MDKLVGRTILGRYRVIRDLGSGGMAQVYQAWDNRRATNVALKMLNADLAEDFVFLRRFAGEAQTLERLRHPHIVRFLGFEEGRGRAFLVMEYIQGPTLRRYLRLLARPLHPAEALRLLKPVCGALHYAHQEGVLHCDVKPANIFVERGGRVVLGDFGIARMSESATVTFSTPGTPAYMSPEQCRGGVALDERSDVYSLGITLYEMLTLDRPFTGETSATAGSRGERVRWEQLNATPPSPRRVNPRISPAVESVILRALEKDPGRRYPGALAFYRALEQAAAVQPAVDLPPVIDEEEVDRDRDQETPPEPKPSPPAVPRSRRGMVVVLGGVAVIALLLFAFVGGTPPNTPPPEATASEPPAPTSIQVTDSAPTEEVVVPVETTIPPPTSTPVPTPVPSNVYILYVLDASNSMQSKMADVKAGLTQHLQGLDPTINVGLLPYGHLIHALEDSSCSAANVPGSPSLQTGSAPTLIQQLGEVSAIGRSPLQQALRKSFQAFSFEPDRTNAVILITGGWDDCGGNPQMTVYANRDASREMPIYVIGIGTEEADRLGKLASETNGRYEQASGADRLSDLLDEFVTEINR